MAAKAAEWRAPLVSATLHSIWTVKKLSLDQQSPRFPSLPDATTPTQINDSLLNHFFPPQPPRSLHAILRPYTNCTVLTSEDVATALSKCSPSSAPDPDTFSYSVWKSIPRHASAVLTSLGPLLQYGHHASPLKKANGVILDKPGKPSSNSPASFLIIVLLQNVFQDS